MPSTDEVEVISLGNVTQNESGRALALPEFRCLLCGRTREQPALANEGEVVAAARSIGDSGAAIGGDVESGGVADAAAVNRDRAAPGVANADGVAGVAAAVHIADGNCAAVRGSSRNAAVTGRSGICVLHGNALPN